MLDMQLSTDYGQIRRRRSDKAALVKVQRISNSTFRISWNMIFQVCKCSAQDCCGGRLYSQLIVHFTRQRKLGCMLPYQRKQLSVRQIYKYQSTRRCHDSSITIHSHTRARQHISLTNTVNCLKATNPNLTEDGYTFYQLDATNLR